VVVGQASPPAGGGWVNDTIRIRLKALLDAHPDLLVVMAAPTEVEIGIPVCPLLTHSIAERR